MSGDYCATKTLENVTVQENGIIRNSKGYLIGRLTDKIGFDSPHLDDVVMSELKFDPYISTKAFGDVIEAQYLYYCKELDKWYSPDNQLNHAMGNSNPVKIPTYINVMEYVEHVKEVDDSEQLE